MSRKIFFVFEISKLFSWKFRNGHFWWVEKYFWKRKRDELKKEDVGRMGKKSKTKIQEKGQLKKIKEKANIWRS